MIAKQGTLQGEKVEYLGWERFERAVPVSGISILTGLQIFPSSRMTIIVESLLACMQDV